MPHPPLDHGAVLAFPYRMEHRDNVGGITHRDYFAAICMGALICRENMPIDDAFLAQAAETAYKAAEACILVSIVTPTAN